MRYLFFDLVCVFSHLFPPSKINMPHRHAYVTDLKPNIAGIISLQNWSQLLRLSGFLRPSDSYSLYSDFNINIWQFWVFRHRLFLTEQYPQKINVSVTWCPNVLKMDKCVKIVVNITLVHFQHIWTSQNWDI